MGCDTVKLLAGLSVIQKYAMIGLAAALAASVLANGMLTKAWLGARDDVAAAIAKCNQDKLTSIAEAERITREAVQEAAEREAARKQAEHEREIETMRAELQKAAEDQKRQQARNKELQQLAEDAFDEDDLPDSNAALNVYLTSCALRSVLHAGDNREASEGGVSGDEICADTGGPDGVHPGFSNVTYGDALRYWGQDRDTVRRLNGKLAQIRQIQGELVDEQD